jgi:hypothetical protein
MDELRKILDKAEKCPKCSSWIPRMCISMNAYSIECPVCSYESADAETPHKAVEMWNDYYMGMKRSEPKQ